MNRWEKGLGDFVQSLGAHGNGFGFCSELMEALEGFEQRNDTT